MTNQAAIVLTALWVVWPAFGEGLAGTATTKEPVTIQLADQWEKPANLRAPLAQVTVLTVADRAGAAQINDWITPLKLQFGTNIQFFAVPDVSAVPGPLRGMVRRRFAKEYAYPIGLDWQGVVSGRLPIKPQAANLFLLDRNGHVQHSVKGSMEPPPLKALTNVIAALLPAARKPTALGRIAGRDEQP